MNTTTLGARGEQLACRYLQRSGFSLISRNWRNPRGEIDVIAREGAQVVIIEVKTRSGPGFGHPFEAITPEKVSRLRRLAGDWAQENGVPLGSIRMDAVAVTLEPERPAIFEHLRGID